MFLSVLIVTALVPPLSLVTTESELETGLALYLPRWLTHQRTALPG
jgi:hypothetical protein